MKTTGASFLTLAALALLGCSGADEAGSPNEESAAGETSPSTSSSSEAPCPSLPTEAGAALPDAGSEMPASPVAACKGYYGSNFVSGWLHRTSAGCQYDGYMVLGEDGSVVELLGSKRTGTWEGDEYYFTMLVGSSHYSFSRKPTAPSE